MRAGKEPVRFDSSYYARFYEDPATRVDDDEHHGKLACGIVSLVEYFGQGLERVLDVGAGTGRWGRWLREHRPATEVVSTELEADTCARFGHLQRDIASWRDRRRYDLVICQGVLPYLDDESCTKALENLVAMTRGFLYLEAVTRRDLDTICDLERTDTRVHRRTGAWYLRQLRPSMVQVGAGLFYVRSGPLTFFQLEALS